MQLSIFIVIQCLVKLNASLFVWICSSKSKVHLLLVIWLVQGCRILILLREAIIRLFGRPVAQALLLRIISSFFWKTWLGIYSVTVFPLIIFKWQTFKLALIVALIGRNLSSQAQELVKVIGTCSWKLGIMSSNSLGTMVGYSGVCHGVSYSSLIPPF